MKTAVPEWRDILLFFGGWWSKRTIQIHLNRFGHTRAAMPQGIHGGIPLRAFVPNAITALALCCGLSGVRFGIGGQWELAVGMMTGFAVPSGAS